MDDKQNNLWELFSPPQDAIWGPIFYFQLILLAEVLATLVAPLIGIPIHALTLIAIFINSALELNQRRRRFILALSLAPLIRILDMSIPKDVILSVIENEAQMIWVAYSVVGFLLFVSAFVTIRITNLDPKRVGFSFGKLHHQVGFGLVGIPLGFIEYLILKPAPQVASFSIHDIWLPIVVITLFTGVLEEVIFRGILQQVAIANYGRFGFTFVSLVFAVLHLGYQSVLDVFFVFFVAMIFSWYVNKTNSLLGVSIAHSITNIGLLIIFPNIL
jgi:membrane protease YdiL (CAAX protease family)